jgi:hypothetical protein
LKKGVDQGLYLQRGPRIYRISSAELEVVSYAAFMLTKKEEIGRFIVNFQARDESYIAMTKLWSKVTVVSLACVWYMTHRKINDIDFPLT